MAPPIGNPRPIEPTANRVAPGDPVSLIMRAPVSTVATGLDARRVADQLTADEVGALVVEGAHGPVGLISERDLVAALGRGDGIDGARAGDLMTSDVIWARPEDSIETVGRLMLEAGIRHIPVRRLRRRGPLGDLETEAADVIGMVSVRDVLAVLLG